MAPRRDGEIGRRDGLKIRCPQGRGGSSPPPGTRLPFGQVSSSLRELGLQIARLQIPALRAGFEFPPGTRPPDCPPADPRPSGRFRVPSGNSASRLPACRSLPFGQVSSSLRELGLQIARLQIPALRAGFEFPPGTRPSRLPACRSEGPVSVGGSVGLGCGAFVPSVIHRAPRLWVETGTEGVSANLSPLNRQHRRKTKRWSRRARGH